LRCIGNQCPGQFRADGFPVKIGCYRIKCHCGSNRHTAACRIDRRLHGGIIHTVSCPAHKAVALRQCTGICRQSIALIHLDLLCGFGRTVFHDPNSICCGRLKGDQNRTIRRCVYGKDISILLYRGIAGCDLIADNLIAAGRIGGHTAAADRNCTIGSIIGLRGDGIVCCGGTAGGGFITGRHIFLKQLKSQLRIINKDIPGTGDGLYRVITTHFPGIHRVSFYPVKKNFHALHNAVTAPHIIKDFLFFSSPTNIYIQNSTSYIAANIICRAIQVGIKEPCAYAVCLISSAGVIAGSFRSYHHNIYFIDTATVAAAGSSLTIWPGMLPVPCSSAVPFRSNLTTGV